MNINVKRGFVTCYRFLCWASNSAINSSAIDKSTATPTLPADYSLDGAIFVSAYPSSISRSRCIVLSFWFILVAHRFDLGQYKPPETWTLVVRAANKPICAKRMLFVATPGVHLFGCTTHYNAADVGYTQNHIKNDVSHWHAHRNMARLICVESCTCPLHDTIHLYTRCALLRHSVECTCASLPPHESPRATAWMRPLAA